ncbi:hypothetical protein LPJ63_002619 [Coemansia sp. RSA 2711]|nr:hypothetical protein LPJ63_002619 [Coemansia sp. RSA 2711]
MQEPQQQEGSPGSLRLQRPMMHHELESFKKLQSFVYEYDSYSLPLFAQLHEVSPESTKLSQLECLPIIGNLAVFAILARFIAQSSDFDCLGASTKLKMYGIALMFLVVGFVPFFNVWIVYRTKPLYRSFCPMPTNRNTAAESEFAPNRDTRGDLDYASRDSRFDSQYERMSVGKRLFESMRVSAFPEEADFLKSKYSVRQSALDNWPLK